MKALPTPFDLQELANQIRPGTTECAGRFARRAGCTLSELRETMREAERNGMLTVWQGGKQCSVATLRGPFRIGPAKVDAGSTRNSTMHRF